MKTRLNFFRVGLHSIGGIVMMALLFSACKKTDNTNYNTPLAGLMAFNLTTDKPAIGFSLSGNKLTNAPLNYTSYTGSYLPVYAGTRNIISYDFNSGTSISTVDQNFEVNKYYSVFSLGANGNYRNLVVEDELDSLSAAGGQAFIRYINAIPDSTKPVVSFTANGTDISNANATYATVSDFTGVNPGEITVKVANGSTISANRNITFEKGKIYTILFTGIAGATDPGKLVEIKYISNGRIQ